MRVALLHPAREENGEQIPESTSAFRLGRITDLTDPITGVTTPADVVAEKLLEAARAENPDLTARIEVLVESGDGTSTWLPQGQVPPDAVSPEGVTISAPELTIDQPQEANPA